MPEHLRHARRRLHRAPERRPRLHRLVHRQRPVPGLRRDGPLHAAEHPPRRDAQRRHDHHGREQRPRLRGPGPRPHRRGREQRHR
ncbi:MAG: hypothetical protein ACTHW4_11400, partial [Actinomycetales bacterium]